MYVKNLLKLSRQMEVNCVGLNDNSDNLNKVVDFKIYSVQMKIKGKLGTPAQKFCREGTNTIVSFLLSSKLKIPS